MNFYYNTNKVWIPDKKLRKIEKSCRTEIHSGSLSQKYCKTIEGAYDSFSTESNSS